MKTIRGIEIEIRNLIKKVEIIQIEITELKKTLHIPVTKEKWYIDLNKLLEAISELTEVSVIDLKSSCIKRKNSDARKMYYKRAREITPYTFFKIGFIINRCHSAVLSGIREVDRVPDLKKQYDKYFGKEKTDKQYLVPGGNKFVITSKIIKRPFAELEPFNNRGFHGYTKHSL